MPAVRSDVFIPGLVEWNMAHLRLKVLANGSLGNAYINPLPHLSLALATTVITL